MTTLDESLRALELRRSDSELDLYRWRCAMVRSGRGNEVGVKVGDRVDVLENLLESWVGTVVHRPKDWDDWSPKGNVAVRPEDLNNQWALRWVSPNFTRITVLEPVRPGDP